MPNFLLTGAGFSRNWGGWLASEAFEYLIGCDGIHPRVRRLLWDHKDKGGFESVYQILKSGATNQAEEAIFRGFHTMVTGMFHTMGHGFASALMGANILTFLLSFDAIFSLNQDTLIELKYPDDEGIRQRSQGKFIGYECPGLRRIGSGSSMLPGLYASLDGPYSLTPGRQPYFKLHGSSNWVQNEASDLMLIIGGNKSAEIQKQPLLKWYHEQFQKMIAGHQVVIIGYSFNDDHINQYLIKAVSVGTRLFIIDPMGVDIIDKRAKGVGHIPEPSTPFMDCLVDAIDGASRRDLIRTFSGDDIEYGKIHHFITRDWRKNP